MSDLATQLIALLNQIANALGRFLLAPLDVLPGMIGASIVAIVSGVLLLVFFKYTSPQLAIKNVRNGIKAELLALSLFKDSIAVSLTSQRRILQGAMKLILFSLIPISMMAIPVTLLLGQMSLWWEARPARIGENVVVTLSLRGTARSGWPKIALTSTPGLDVINGPFRVRSRRELCWELQARTAGYHQLVFEVDGRKIEKDIAVGGKFMRVSIRRPEWKWSEMLQHPAESPFLPNDPVESIAVQYPADTLWTEGRYSSFVFHSWLVFWFLGSTIAAFCFSGVLKVNL